MKFLHKRLKSYLVVGSLIEEEFMGALNAVLQEFGETNIIDIQFSSAATDGPIVWSALVLYEEPDIN